MKKTHVLRTFALSMVLLLLACTALAVGLDQSERHAAVRLAREAVMEKYGLTTETLGFFIERTEQDKDGYTVTLDPVKYIDEPGVYTVVVDKKGNATASWSHDGVDLDKLDISSKAWGNAQLEEVLAMEHKHQNTRVGGQYTQEEMTEQLRLEIQAERDRILAEASEKGMDVFMYHVLPGEGEMSLQEAIDYAKQVIRKTYALETETEPAYNVNVDLIQYADKEEPTYRINFNRPLPGGEKDEYDGFFVTFGAGTGDVERCSWGIPAKYRTLPDGPLDTYKVAVDEYIEEGAFALDSPEEKADIAGRMEAAGFTGLLPFDTYLMPEDGDIPQETALRTAEKALIDTFGFTPETLAAFKPDVSLIDEDGARVWAIEYAPDVKEIDEWLYKEPMGIYTVRVDAESGDVLKAKWSLQAVFDRQKDYDPERFGAFEAWDAKTLPNVLENVKQHRAYHDKYDKIFEESGSYAMPDWSMEDLAALDGLMRDAGFSSKIFYNGLPRDEDLTREEAINLAFEAVKMEFGADEKRLNEAALLVIYSVADEDQPIWDVRIFMPDSAYDSYTVEMDAQTGEILFTEFIVTGNG